MAFVIECRNPYNENSVDFTGPFDSKRDAEVFLLLPLPGGILHCQRTHTIHELITPHAEKVDLSTVMRVVDEATGSVQTQKALELARRCPPFAVNRDGTRIDRPTFEEVRDSLILTIKALREQYEGIGLKEAKEIVDEWRDNLNPCWHLGTQVGNSCPKCKVFVR